MRELWKQFVLSFGDAPDLACGMLLVGSLVLVVTPFILARWIADGLFGLAAGGFILIGFAVATCWRDWRRGRFGLLSTALMVSWIVAAAGAVAYGWWAYDKG